MFRKITSLLGEVLGEADFQDMRLLSSTPTPPDSLYFPADPTPSYLVGTFVPRPVEF